jgi:hypothetical protein
MQLTQAEAAWRQSTGDSRELCRHGHGAAALCARGRRENKRGVKVSEEGEAEGEPGHRRVGSGAWARVGGGGASAPSWSPRLRHVPASEAFYRAAGGLWSGSVGTPIWDVSGRSWLMGPKEKLLILGCSPTSVKGHQSVELRING